MSHGGVEREEALIPPETRLEGLEEARRVADAVLYEGYVLYPYRASAIKNRFRWQYGIVAPRGSVERGGADPCAMQAELLVAPEGEARLAIELRYLQVEERLVEEVLEGGEWRAVESLTVGGETLTSWQEGVPRTLMVDAVPLRELLESPRRIPFTAPEGTSRRTLEEDARPRGALVRRRWPIEGELELSAERIGSLWKVRLRVENDTPWESTLEDDRAAALRQACVGTHALLKISGGRFLSLQDPPVGAAEGARSCLNEHCWPVLVGAPGAGEALFVSPILLDDYPRTAPESPGDLYDATEIDEILMLRIMTLTDEEKAEARSTDERARRVIERADAMSDEVFARLHGTIRSLRPIDDGEAVEAGRSPLAPATADPWHTLLGEPTREEKAAAWSGSTRIAEGTRVTLRPKRNADAMDMFLAGRSATVAAVYLDVDGTTYVAVTLDDDPGRDLHDWYGRFYYFYPEEIEPIGADAGTRRAGD